MDIMLEARSALLFVEPMSDAGCEWLAKYSRLFSFRFGNKLAATLGSLPDIKVLLEEENVTWGEK